MVYCTAPLSSNTAGWNLSDEARGRLVKRRQMKQGGFLGMKGQQPWAGKESGAVICTQVPGRWEVCESHPYSHSLTDSPKFWPPNLSWEQFHCLSSEFISLTWNTVTIRRLVTLQLIYHVLPEWSSPKKSLSTSPSSIKTLQMSAALLDKAHTSPSEPFGMWILLPAQAHFPEITLPTILNPSGSPSVVLRPETSASPGQHQHTSQHIFWEMHTLRSTQGYSFRNSKVGPSDPVF